MADKDSRFQRQEGYLKTLNMESDNNSQKLQWSRRIFLKSSALFFAGVSFFKPSVFAAGKAVMKRDDTILPDGTKAVWDLSKAWKETTPTRERICINGLWQWQPGDLSSEILPDSGWGYFKVPGPWPNASEARNENQTLYTHPAWNGNLLKDVTASWFQRELNIPANWSGRRIILSMKYINSNAIVYIDNQKAGELWFPDGEIDITSFCKPGSLQHLTIKVKAVPLKDVITAYSDTNMGRQVQAVVARKGICGDIFISSVPKGPYIDHVAVETSVRRGEITFKTGLINLAADKKYKLRVLITFNNNQITEFTSNSFVSNDLAEGSFTLTEKWIAENLWDTHTPQNIYKAEVTLVDATEKKIDIYNPVRFGYREFWIEGRDFYLNGSRIWLSCIPLDNAQSGVAIACYEGAKESLSRLKSTGINFVYAHNYDSEPGSHISFDEILTAADDTGMLVAQSQPHFSAYDWDSTDADIKNGYAHHAAFYTRVARNHPSVVFYSTSHNATGYNQDMNPELIGGRDRQEGSTPNKNVPKALRAEAIIHKLDPSRIVYHHSSGNLSSMYTCNFYGNWIPAQEMNEWFSHWAAEGELPAILVEYSTPFTWDYGMYRGWYKGKREFGSAMVPWEFCLAEWNSQFIGDLAYSISEYEKANLRWEADKFSKGEVWGRSQYPYSFDSSVLDERNRVLAEHFASNCRAFRTWGVSGVNAMWHYTEYWNLRKDIEKKPKIFITDWDNLQKPGFSPDFITRQQERFDMGYSMSDWEQTIAAKAITDNHGPLLAYIGGKPESFTDKAHNFLPGQLLEKQLIIINNSRETIQCDCQWIINFPEPLKGNRTISLQTGKKENIPLNIKIPENLQPGQYELKAEFLVNRRISLTDTIKIDILAQRSKDQFTAGIALFDPEGETARLLDSFGITYKSIGSGTDLSGFDLLIIGKKALKTDSPGPDVTSIREGLKMVVFEQSAEVLEQRFGFRVQEYGLRRVFKRIADHPVLNGIGEEHLRDWRGEATLVPPRLEGAPGYKWCGIPVPRVWRCGTRGNVASVLIEKPACGDFLPVIDGGFSLQYSPLMEYREGKGMVIFCQMDVTARTENDPAAEMIVWNIISYAEGWKPSVTRQALYAGDPAGKMHLGKASIKIKDYTGGKLSPEQVLIIGPQNGQVLTKNIRFINKWLKTGGKMLTIGLDQQELSILLPGIQMKKAEHIAASLKPFDLVSPFAGISSADVHNRAPREVPLVSSGATIAGNGVLAATEGVTLCQLVPWQLDFSNEQHNIKQTYRRSSFLFNRLLGNLGIASTTDFLSRFKNPVDKAIDEKRWLTGLYLDIPEEWDDPYRFFRW